jgi:hypothetical protein
MGLSPVSEAATITAFHAPMDGSEISGAHPQD